jgi:hypothetical protein
MGVAGVDVAVGGIGVGDAVGGTGVDVLVGMGVDVGGTGVEVLVGMGVDVGGTGVDAGAHPLAQTVRRTIARIDNVTFFIFFSSFLSNHAWRTLEGRIPPV